MEEFVKEISIMHQSAINSQFNSTFNRSHTNENILMKLKQVDLSEENFILKEQISRLNQSNLRLEEEFSIFKRQSKSKSSTYNTQIAQLDNSLTLKATEEQQELMYMTKQLKSEYLDKESALKGEIAKLKDQLVNKEMLRSKCRIQWEEQFQKLREELRQLQTDNISLKLQNEKFARNVAELAGEKRQKDKFKLQVEELVHKLNSSKAQAASLNDLILQVKPIQYLLIDYSFIKNHGMFDCLPELDKDSCYVTRIRE